MTVNEDIHLCVRTRGSVCVLLYCKISPSRLYFSKRYENSSFLIGFLNFRADWQYASIIKRTKIHAEIYLHVT